MQKKPIRKTEELSPRKVLGETPSGCMIYVSVAHSEDQGRSFRFEKGTAVVGREADCDLVLSDPSVSRRHVKLEITHDGIEVEDLGSTNGIAYLGKRIQRATLQLGSRLEVGHCQVDLLPLTDAGEKRISSREEYGELIGQSLPMRQLFATLELLENSDAPVLIEGETGTGKDLVAQALHSHGLRSEKPFVIIDCANVPSELMESELFGHRKGAFTGAVADRCGAFESARGGTVFLDELGELPLELQPKLLRVIETGQIRRLGDTRHVLTDVRILAATKRNLSEEVAQGRFREDLFYRIAVVRLQMPSLRERVEDIPILIHHLVKQVSKGKLTKLQPEAEELMLHHDWPGNVRELRNAVQRTLAVGLVGIGGSFSRSGAAEKIAAQNGVAEIQPSSFSTVESLPQFQKARDRALTEFEHSYLRALWAKHKGNLSAAARVANMDRKYLRSLLKKHGLY